MQNAQTIDPIHEIADVFHTIFCHTEHGGMPEDIVLAVTDLEDKCTYYVEEQMEDTWSYPAHVNWFDQAKNLMLALVEDGIKEPHEAIGFLNNVAQIVGKIHKLTPQSGMASDLVAVMLKTTQLSPPLSAPLPPSPFLDFDPRSTE